MPKGYSPAPVFVPPLRGLTHMISDMPGEERSGEDPNLMTSDMKDQGV